MPPFDHLHPAVVHFAIAPLVLSPFFIGLGLIWRSQRRGLLTAVLLLALAGLACAIISMLSGEAVERFARATPELKAAVQAHEHIAQRATLVSAGLVALLLAHWTIPMIRRKEQSRNLENALLVVCLAGSLLAAGLMLRTGHLGGVMVHKLGTHAQPPPAAM